MTSSLLFTIIIGLLLFSYFFELALDILNDSNRKPEIPAEAQGIYDDAAYAKSQNYQRENSRFGYITGVIGLLSTLAMFLFDGFAYVDEIVRQWFENEIVIGLVFLGGLSLVSDLIGIPFSLYNVFVIEEKYGFNKTTIGTFFLDKLKGYALGGIIGGVLFSAIFWFYLKTGASFWWIAWLIVATFMLLMTTFYTAFIVPLFNKLSPLEEGELRHEIEKYAAQVGFDLKNIFVMDGSKRSSKANAYFSGLGKQKSIVLYDTLIANHSVNEIVAVLAHEVGHYKKKHTQWGLLLSIVQIGITLFLFSLMVNNPLLSEALHVKQHSFYIALLVFGIIYSPISTLLGLGMNLLSRKNEFEADAYAKATYNGAELVKALKKLSVDSLSNLTPHPWYVFFHYSHPPLLERMRAIESK